MNLRALGEERLITRLLRGHPVGQGVRVGPGDDCAVTARRGENVLTLLKTDAVVEGIHFAPEADFRRVGWKALARAVSDIAAMGGEPEHALITLALPPSLPVRRAKALYAGVYRCARRFGIGIVGGETTRSPDGADGAPGPVFVSVTLTGRVEKARLVTRSGGKPGDVLFVTGRLGGSLAGKHLDFTPRLEEARWLCAHYRPRAMMDLSDGLGADLPRLARASGCGFRVEEGEIPLTPGCTLAQAVGDGEDFELLFALAPRRAGALERAWPFATLPLTRIGVLTANLRERRLTTHGYDHFTHSAANR